MIEALEPYPTSRTSLKPAVRRNLPTTPRRGRRRPTSRTSLQPAVRRSGALALSSRRTPTSRTSLKPAVRQMPPKTTFGGHNITFMRATLVMKDACEPQPRPSRQDGRSKLCRASPEVQRTTDLLAARSPSGSVLRCARCSGGPCGGPGAAARCSLPPPSGRVVGPIPRKNHRQNLRRDS